MKKRKGKQRKKEAMKISSLGQLNNLCNRIFVSSGTSYCHTNLR